MMLCSGAALKAAGTIPPQQKNALRIGIKVDFNQGLDARLIDDSVAKLLSKVKWLEPVRLEMAS